MPAAEKNQRTRTLIRSEADADCAGGSPKPAVNVPWKRWLRCRFERVPMPLARCRRPTSCRPRFSDSLGHYADAGFQPMKPAEPVSREKKIESYEQTLDGANYVQQHLQGQQSRLFGRSAGRALAQFSQGVAPATATGKQTKRCQPSSTMPGL